MKEPFAYSTFVCYEEYKVVESLRELFEIFLGRDIYSDNFDRKRFLVGQAHSKIADLTVYYNGPIFKEEELSKDRVEEIRKESRKIANLHQKRMNEMAKASLTGNWLETNPERIFRNLYDEERYKLIDVSEIDYDLIEYA